MSTETGEIFVRGPFAEVPTAPRFHRASPGTGDALSGDTPNVAGVGDVPANSKGESSRDAAPDASFLSKEPLAPASGNAARERADRARAGGVSSFAAHETLSAASAGSAGSSGGSATPTIARVWDSRADDSRAAALSPRATTRDRAAAPAFKSRTAEARVSAEVVVPRLHGLSRAPSESSRVSTRARVHGRRREA